ncbi:hypothetical protein LZ32DRAFT_354544 [Colletotrichum eremochloae]|nr:hypothetical protein LZ32DRAFT_354544 [Colletotrichum eremochloae]
MHSSSLLPFLLLSIHPGIDSTPLSSHLRRLATPLPSYDRAPSPVRSRLLLLQRQVWYIAASHPFPLITERGSIGVETKKCDRPSPGGNLPGTSREWKKKYSRVIKGILGNLRVAVCSSGGKLFHEPASHDVFWLVSCN